MYEGKNVVTESRAKYLVKGGGENRGGEVNLWGGLSKNRELCGRGIWGGYTAEGRMLAYTG